MFMERPYDVICTYMNVFINDCEDNMCETI